MTIHIKMLHEIAANAWAMAEASMAMAQSMQAIVDDCAEQLARRMAAGESEEAVMNEAIGSKDMQPYAGPTPFDEQSAVSPASEKPKLTIVELRAFVAECSTPENRPKIKAILGQFGVKKLTELREEQYGAVMAEVRKACLK